MKAIGIALKAHLAGDVTTTARLWKFTRTDNAVFGFTDHDEPITYGGVTYESAVGMTASAVESGASLAVPNGEVQGVFDSSTLTEADLLAGVWDFAIVEVFEVNYKDLTQGAIQHRRGWLGEVRTNRNGFAVELRGMSQAVQQVIGRTVGPACDADVFDARCGLDVNVFVDGKTTASVVSASSNRLFVATALTQPTAWFAGGLLTWTSGANAGFSMEVKTFTLGGTVELFQPMPRPIANGDAFEVQAGCDKSLATCRDKFANVINFRGFPHLPGVARIFSGK